MADEPAGNEDYVRQVLRAGLPAQQGTALTFDDLSARVERQNLVLQTVLALLLEKRVVDEEELHQWVNYIDRLDGRLDGKLTEDRSPRACPACNRKNPAAAARCAYCGHDLGQSGFDPRARGGGGA